MTGDKTQDPRLPHSSEAGVPSDAADCYALVRALCVDIWDKLHPGNNLLATAQKMATVVAEARTVRNAHAMYGLRHDAPQWALEKMYEALAELDDA